MAAAKILSGVTLAVPALPRSFTPPHARPRKELPDRRRQFFQHSSDACRCALGWQRYRTRLEARTPRCWSEST